jgi:hypothetical protein
VHRKGVVVTVSTTARWGDVRTGAGDATNGMGAGDFFSPYLDDNQAMERSAIIRFAVS